jgi:glycosyltransferase involved in cell wall biosynthesis
MISRLVCSRPREVSSSSQPLISIGMSVRNNVKTLATAVRSILQQSYRNWEMLLIDDGSTDGTLAVAKNFADPRVQMITDGRNQGLPARLNQAVRLARGIYFARMDGDDVAYPERLEKQIAYLRQHPEVDLLATRAITFGRGGVALGGFPGGETHTQICRRPRAGFHFLHPTWMGRVEWFRANRYRADVLKSQDQDILLRTYRHSRFACLPEPLLGYREEKLSLGKNLITRYYLARALLRNARSKGNYALTLGVPEQALKALVDIIAVGTGLNYTLLRHRVPAAPAADVQRWQQVWAACQAETEPS